MDRDTVHRLEPGAGATDSGSGPDKRKEASGCPRCLRTYVAVCNAQGQAQFFGAPSLREIECLPCLKSIVFVFLLLLLVEFPVTFLAGQIENLPSHRSRDVTDESFLAEWVADNR